MATPRLQRLSPLLSVYDSGKGGKGPLRLSLFPPSSASLRVPDQATPSCKDVSNEAPKVPLYTDGNCERVVFALIIINKAGGLIYQRDFANGLNKLSINDYLVLAGTFHSVHALTTRLNPLHEPPQRNSVLERPEAPSGIEVLETENFRLQCFSTLTGTKFLLFTDPMQINIDAIVRKIYELYADYVMKNPFYQMEMPVRCESFDRKLLAYIRPLNSR